MTIMESVDEEITNKKKKKKSKRKTKKKHHILFYKILSFILIIITLFTIGYSFIEELLSIFYLIPISLVFLLIIFFICFILNKNKLKRWIKNIFSFIAIIIIIIESLFLIFGMKTLKFLTNITDTGYRIETFGVYVLKSSEYESLADLDNKKVSYLNHDDDKNIKEALKKIKKQIKITYDKKDTANELVDTLVDGKVDAILMDTSYESILREEEIDLYNELKLIEEIDIIDLVDTIKSDVDITKDPFVVYVSGIDTSGNVASKARSDVNILIGVNPKTNKILLVNTPRDYYVTLHKNGKKDKLTHAGLYGVEESLNTLSDLYDVNIDYYVRINFTSFIKIVNALGGVEVNVPINFCEQNSKRSKKDDDIICLNKGKQTLNGEQALALARHRHTLPTGDRGRGENQMLILKAIINKAMSPKVITKYNNIISALNGRVTTNMTTNEMYKFAKMQIDNGFSWDFETMSATGKDSRGVCYATGSGKAYVMEPDMETVNNIIMAFDDLFEENEVSN